MANVMHTMAIAPAAQIPVLEEFEKQGIEIKRFPPAVMQALQAESMKVLQAEAEKDPIFKEALDSLLTYMENVNQWHDIQSLSTD